MELIETSTFTKQITALLRDDYSKNVAADLTPKQVSQLARGVKEEFGDEKADV